MVEHGAGGFGGFAPPAGGAFQLQPFGFPVRGQFPKIVGRHSCIRRLELNPGLGFDALLVGVFDYLHFGYQVGEVD